MGGRRRALRWGALVVLAAAALCAIALAVTGYLTHRHLRDAQAAVGQLRLGLASTETPTAQIDAHLRDIQSEARAARELTDGPLWGLPARLPRVGAPFETVRGAAAAIDTVAHDVLPPVRGARDSLVGVDLRRHGGGLDLAPVSAAAAPLGQARGATDRALARAENLPSTGVHQIDAARGELLAQLGALSAQLRSAHEAVTLLPPMLGANEPRRYFVAFQNNAEARGTGGLPGVYAVLRADRGRISFEHYGVSGDFGGVRVSMKGLSPGFASQYQGAAPDRFFGNTTVSPHFPDGAQLMMRYWQGKTGERLDGALALDPSALSMLLAVTGPSTLPDGTVVKASNVVALTERDAYARFDDPVARKLYLIEVAKAVADDVLERGPAQGSQLAGALADAVAERRVLLYSARSEEQRIIGARPVGGTLSDTTGRFSGLVINNAGGNKLDYYLDRQVTYAAASCGARDQRATVTVRLTNRAPRSGLGSYAGGRADPLDAPVPRGTNRLLVGYYATKGADFSEATVDGKPAFLDVDTERGRPVFTFVLEIAPGQTRTLTLRIDEPAGAKGPVTTLVQPLVLPQRTRVTIPDCPGTAAR